MADFGESCDVADGEEITNKIPDICGDFLTRRQAHQMCPFDADFKHFRVALGQDFLRRRKVSSIMRAKVLSIMRSSPAR